MILNFPKNNSTINTPTDDVVIRNAKEYFKMIQNYQDAGFWLKRKLKKMVRAGDIMGLHSGDLGLNLTIVHYRFKHYAVNVTVSG